MVGKKYFKKNDIVFIVKDEEIKHLGVINKIPQKGELILVAGYGAIERQFLELYTFARALKTHYKSDIKYFRHKYKLFTKMVENVEKVRGLAIDTFGEDRISFNEISDDYFYGFIVKFPKITISNSLGLTHDIHNMYIKIEFKMSTFTSMTGLKTTFTNSELQNGYLHSHINWSTGERVNFHKFCLGEGEFQSMYSNLQNNEIEIDTLELFLVSIESFLSWESVEGIPYKYMSTVGKYKIAPEDKLNLMTRRLKLFEIKDEIFKMIDYGKINGDVSVINGDAFVVLSKESIESVCNKLCENEIYYVNGKYFLESSQQQSHRISDIGNINVKFKGNQLELNIIEDESEMVLTEEHKKVNPQYVKKTYLDMNKEFINYQILNYEYRKTRVKKESAVDNN